MAVRNLGVARRRPSVLSGLSQGLSQGIDIARIAQNEKNRKTQEKASENRLAAELAAQTIRKSERDIKNVRKTHEQFSLQFNAMDKQQKAVFKGSDQYKELVKFFKGFSNLVPGLVNDKGDIVATTDENTFSNKLDELTAKARIAVAEGIATQTQVQLLRMSSKDKDLLADALADAARNVKQQPGQPKGAGILEHVVNFMRNVQSKFGIGDRQSALSQPAQQLPVTPIAPIAAPPGASSPQQVNPNTGGLRDPLGILK